MYIIKLSLKNKTNIYLIKLIRYTKHKNKFKLYNIIYYIFSRFKSFKKLLSYSFGSMSFFI